MIGTTIGPYRVLEKLGEGGMGVVYRARDTKLNRDVAIKVLPASFAQDAERLARFTREAQTLAALNHPNIAHIHGFEESAGVRALVMELVDGPTLAEVIDAAGDHAPNRSEARQGVGVGPLDAARKEAGHRFPVFLPDGDHFLFAALPGTDGVYTIFASTLRDPLTRTVIGTMESAPVYESGSGQGWLLFTRQGVAAAQPFDAQTLRFTGDAVSLGDEPAVAPGSAAYEAGRRVSVSATGSFAYYLEPSANTNVRWMDQTGKTTGTVSVPPGRYTAVAIAPNNAKAVLVRSDSLTSWSLWVADLTRASAIPLLTGVTRNPSPVWSPDSTRIVYANERSVDHGLYEKNVAAALPERLILRVDNSSVVPRSWSKDQAWIVFARADPGTKWNIFRVPASGSGAPVPLVDGPSIEALGSLSPDNHWLAYLSDEAGYLDLYVQSFPDGRSRTQVVAAGGIQQYWWTPDGAHLLYLKRDESLWRVGVDLRAGPPRMDTPVQLATFPPSLVAIDLAPDGRQFLALVPESAGLGTVVIVQSWRAALPAILR